MRTVEGTVLVMHLIPYAVYLLGPLVLAFGFGKRVLQAQWAAFGFGLAFFLGRLDLRDAVYANSRGDFPGIGDRDVFRFNRGVDRSGCF